MAVQCKRRADGSEKSYDDRVVGDEGRLYDRWQDSYLRLWSLA